MKVKVYNQQAEAVGEQELNPAVFAVPASAALVHQVAVAQTANARQTLAHTKTKAEVRGGGRKPWRQKGTGRARAGSIRSPLWKGGGVTFGPRKDRNFSKKINIKMKRKATLGVLSDRVRSGNLILVDKLELPDAKTKQAAAIIADFLRKVFIADKKTSILIMIADKNEPVEIAMRNLAGVSLIKTNNINIVDLLKYRNIMLTVAA
ncbi:50S ribosomal protein L4, partial [Candidatus Falkowbacteria bacterium CG10_big_fil_rev_8_21_14_0_10_44_15]